MEGATLELTLPLSASSLWVADGGSSSTVFELTGYEEKTVVTVVVNATAEHRARAEYSIAVDGISRRGNITR